MRQKMFDIALGAGDKIVQSCHLMSLRQEPLAKMGADEPGAACN